MKTDNGIDPVEIVVNRDFNIRLDDHSSTNSDLCVGVEVNLFGDGSLVCDLKLFYQAIGKEARDHFTLCEHNGFDETIAAIDRIKSHLLLVKDISEGLKNLNIQLGKVDTSLKSDEN